MKRIFVLALICGSIISCKSEMNSEVEKTDDLIEVVSEATETSFYGEKITTDESITASEFVVMANEMPVSDSLFTKLTVPIVSTCQKKGCWMDVDLGEEQTMTVRFKDYGFFVPTEGVEGRIATFEGVATYDTLGVDYLQHLAEDAGKSENEIALITEPSFEISFEAVGVIIE